MSITNIAHTVHMTFTVFSKFSKWLFVLRILGLFEIWTALILTILAMVNVVQFIISNIAHSVYMRFTVFSKFSKWLFVWHILAYSKFELRSFSPSLLWWTLFKSSFQTLRTVCIWDLQCFESFRNCFLFSTFRHIRNFYSGEAHHANYSKHCLTHHFQHCAHFLYDIYSICKVFEMAVCFTHFALFEIWTALILTILAMVNVVQFIISNIAHSVYMRFTVHS